MTTKKPQRLMSASRGVNVSPLPAPNILAKLTPLNLRKRPRSKAIDQIANGKERDGVLKK